MAELKARILQGERLVDVEVVRKYPGGHERTVSISTAPILDHAGQVGGIIVVGSDTSERKRMEDRLIQLNEALRLVNGILRHDTLNELMVVNGSLDMYQKTKQEKFLETASKAIGRSVEMIKRMKELESMAVSGGSLCEYDLHQVIEDILKGYMVEFQITGEARLFADNALPSAIDNIVRNAMIHGKAERIEAKIWQEGGATYLSIADDGIGIPDIIKQRIFVEGFSYGNNAGSGLGLYLVSKTLERYGGKVRVEDNCPKGTTFILSFPQHLADMSAT
jgi:signal transduction histidine kinase